MTDSSVSKRFLTRRVRNIILIAVGLGVAALIGTIALTWMVFDNDFLGGENACPPDDPALVERAGASNSRPALLICMPAVSTGRDGADNCPLT